MKACTSLFSLALGLASLSACSGGDTTATTSTSSSGDPSTTTGGGGSSGTGSSTTGAGGAGGGAASSTGSATASSSASSGATSSGSGGMAAFALTSTGFTDGMAIPVEYACAPGANHSPDLSWTAGPTGTLSYAVVLTDKSNNLLHWVIWDIPAAVPGLPAYVENKANPAIPAGSKQVKSYDNATFGYLGPCPPSVHTYEFAVFALDIATLPNVTTASTRKQVDTEILNHDLGSATLTGTYTPP